MADTSTPTHLDMRTHLKAVIEAFEDAAALIGADGQILETNRAWQAHGFSEPAFADGDPVPVAAAAAGEIDKRAGLGRRGSADGWRWYRSRVHAILHVEGVAAVLTHRDVTDERRLQIRMARSPVAHLELDAGGQLLAVNERWEELRGRPVGAELGRRWLRDTPQVQRDELHARFQDGKPFEFELSTVGVDDRRLTLMMDFQPLWDGEELISWNVSASDRTDMRALESAAENALIDTVTRLGTRGLFETTLARRLSGRTDGELAILFIDLDQFKAVNDVHGHVIGDAVLRTIAARLAGVLRPEDLIARYGGDEFAVLLADIDTGSALEVGERLVDAGRSPIFVDDLELHVGVSVGIALRRPGDDVVAIIDRADRAMYRAKQAGGGRAEVAS